jgi:hypothetical protein
MIPAASCTPTPDAETNEGQYSGVRAGGILLVVILPRGVIRDEMLVSATTSSHLTFLLHLGARKKLSCRSREPRSSASVRKARDIVQGDEECAASARVVDVVGRKRTDRRKGFYVRSSPLRMDRSERHSTHLLRGCMARRMRTSSLPAIGSHQLTTYSLPRTLVRRSWGIFMPPAQFTDTGKRSHFKLLSKEANIRLTDLPLCNCRHKVRKHLAAQYQTIYSRSAPSMFKPVSIHFQCTTQPKDALNAPSNPNAKYAPPAFHHQAIFETLLKSSTFKISTPSLISTSQT